MRKVRYEDYSAKSSDRARKALRLEKKKGARLRPRSEVERGLLLKLDKARFEKWKREGKLEPIGPRKYRFAP